MADAHTPPAATATPPEPLPAKPTLARQAISGLTPPQQAEAMVREVWPSVVEAQSGLAGLGQMLIKSIVLAPLGWLLLAPLYFKKILPFLSTRYTLTNRRLMIQRGLKPAPVKEVALADIDDVRVAADSHNVFYKSATLEVLTKGGVALTLVGVPEADSFRESILNTVAAWVPGKAKQLRPFLAASAK
jgi:Bacterial PH domain